MKQSPKAASEASDSIGDGFVERKRPNKKHRPVKS